VQLPAIVFLIVSGLLALYLFRIGFAPTVVRPCREGAS
jgi:hypothetical protein